MKEARRIIALSVGTDVSPANTLRQKIVGNEESLPYRCGLKTNALAPFSTASAF